MKKIALFLSAVLALSAVFAAIPASAVNTEKIEGALYERLLSADDGDRFLIAVELTEHFDERSYMNAHADDGEPKDVRASLVNAAEEFYAALNRGFAEKIGGFATVVEISTLTPVILCEAQKKDVLTLSEYDEVLYISAGEALFPDSVSGAASEQDPTQNGIEIAGLPQNECRLLEGDLLVLLRPMTVTARRRAAGKAPHRAHLHLDLPHHAAGHGRLRRPARGERHLGAGRRRRGPDGLDQRHRPAAPVPQGHPGPAGI